MKTTERLADALRAIGATLDETGDRVLYCDAPSGYVWKVNESTTYPILYANGSQSWLAKAVRDALPELRKGLTKVTDPELIAEKRYELGDEGWGAAPDAPDTINFNQ